MLRASAMIQGTFGIFGGYPVNILVFNCGSSSLNYKLYEFHQGQSQIRCGGKAHRVGVKGIEPSFIEHYFSNQTSRTILPIPDHQTAANLVLDELVQRGECVDAVSHRFVHGGDQFQHSILLDKASLSQLQKLMPLAPIHNPNSMSVIRVCLERLPGIPETLTFDTAFHATLPESAYRYDLPADLVNRFGLRRYGFHGLSYQYVTQEASRFLGCPLPELKIVACHLGTGGSSVAAIQNGKSVDTSMGYSPLAGLMMSTRTGDLDPMLVVSMLRREGLDHQTLSDLYNKKSGLLGVSGLSSDIRDLERAAEKNHDATAASAVELYTYRLRKTIGAYISLLGGIDCLIFTDDIGLQNPSVREKTCTGLEWAGIQIDPQANLCTPFNQITVISPAGVCPTVLVMPTDEELIIASEGESLLSEVQDD